MVALAALVRMSKKNGKKSRTEGTGRPLIIPTPEEFDRLVDEYEARCIEETRESKVYTPPTFSGMARFLGFADRQSFYDYKKRDGFSCSVKRAQLLVESSYEARLGGHNVAGAIFALKNHGWSDRQEITGADGGPLTYEDVSEPRNRIKGRVASIANRIGAGRDLSRVGANGNGSGTS
jgi:hypothetical protein